MWFAFLQQNETVFKRLCEAHDIECGASTWYETYTTTQYASVCTQFNYANTTAAKDVNWTEPLIYLGSPLPSQDVPEWQVRGIAGGNVRECLAKRFCLSPPNSAGPIDPEHDLPGED